MTLTQKDNSRRRGVLSQILRKIESRRSLTSVIIKQCKLGVTIEMDKEAHLFCWVKLCQMDTESFHSKKQQKAAVKELFDILSLRSNLPYLTKRVFHTSEAKPHPGSPFIWDYIYIEAYLLFKYFFRRMLSPWGIIKTIVMKLLNNCSYICNASEKGLAEVPHTKKHNKLWWDKEWPLYLATLWLHISEMKSFLEETLNNKEFVGLLLKILIKGFSLTCWQTGCNKYYYRRFEYVYIEFIM